MALNERDKAILANLDRFGLMSRDHIAAIHCGDNARPWATANRILKRLVREGLIVAIPQPRDKPYVYRSKAVNVKANSARFYHHLEIVDAYIELGCPDQFEVEPNWKYYRPDAYAVVNGMGICIEVQRSKVNNEKIQKKINQFVLAYQKGEHYARVLWFRTPFRWEKLKAPTGIKVIFKSKWEFPSKNTQVKLKITPAQ